MKVDIIQERLDRCRDHCSGVLQWESEIGFNSKCIKEKWGGPMA